MENRLPNLQRFVLILVGLFALITVSTAQPVDITFEYSGPDTIIVGNDCTAPLDWGAPNSVDFTCNTVGCVVDTFDLLFIGGGYAENDPIPAGEDVSILYEVQFTNNGSNGTLTVGFTLSFIDTIAPVFDPLTLPPSDNFGCLASVPPVVNPTATDNCPSPGGGSTGVTIVYDGQTAPPLNCAGGTFTRTWTATDDFGNSSSYSQDITVGADNTDPVITGTPTGATETCESSDYAAWIAAQRATFDAVDNGCGILSLTDNAPMAYDEDCSSIDVIFTATDSCSNNVSVTVTYAIIDNADPMITPPASTDITIECDGLPTDPTSQILSWGEDNLTVTDNCTASGDITWTNNFTNLTGGCGGNTGTASVTYTAMDQCGNTAMVTLNFTVNDSNDPDIITGAVDTTVICDGLGNTAELADWLTNRGYANAMDFCTDDDDIVLTLRVGGDVQTPAMIQDSVDSQMAAGCGAFVTVEFAFTDLCGNTSATIGDFVVLDTVAPTITTLASQVIVECDNPSITFASWLETRGGAIATDACTDIDNSTTSPHWTTNIISDVPGPCFDESTRTVEFTVTDQCGLSATTTASYIVEDNGSPTISPTATSIMEECGGGNDQMVLNNWINAFGGATASDVCSDVEWSEISYTTSVGVVDANIAFGDMANYPQIVANDCDWNVEVMFTVRDSCDNTSVTMATFTITDTTDPVLTGTTAANDTLTLDCDAAIPGFPNIVAADNCGAANVVITVDSVQAQISCLYNFVRIRTWTGTDDCGNTSTIAQVLIVQDTTKPFLAGIPADMTVSCDMLPGTPALGTDYTANDNCDVNINDGVVFGEVSTQGNDADDCDFYNYTLTRTWTVTDVCGNAETYTQVITVQDVSNPTFTAPADTTIDCHVSQLPASTGNPIDVLDVCDNNPTVNYIDVVTNPPGSCPNELLIERTWMVEDACGNMAMSQIQMITVQDTLRPEFTMEAVNVNLECTSETAAQDSFINWVAAYGNATAEDLCTDEDDLEWFAAVPGSYDIDDPLTWPGATAPGGLTSSTCPSPTPGIYRSETVDFVVHDECDIANVSTATFNIIDTDAPDFEYCPSDDNVVTDPGECFATYVLPAPIISDGCNAMLMYTFPETEAISSNTPGDDDAIVNTVVIDFTGLPAAPILASGMVTLDLDFTMLDGEEPTEFFNIFGDDGSLLGTSDPTPSQCGNVTTTLMIPAATYNVWASDGEVNITLVPNIPAGQPSVFAINDICPSGTGTGASVTGTLSFAANDPNGLVFQYDINGDPLVTVDPIGPTTVNLLVGDNDITYYATDCAGNTETCEFTVTVEDTEAPVLACPADIDYYLVPGDDCGNIDIQLEIPTMVTDNCPFDINSQTQPGSNADALLTFAYNPNYLEYVAEDKDFNFVGVAANAVGATATFTVTITGDADDPEEYFTILDEDGNSLGTTEVGQANVTVTPAACPVPGTTVAVFTVPTATFNMWAADGNIAVSAVSNNTFGSPSPGGPDDGINPSCAPFAPGTDDGETDNISTIFIEMEYQSTDLFYSTTGATETPLTEMLPPAIAPTVSFDLGQTDVTYTVYDNGNNEATCSFVVNVLDTIPPVAVCEPTTIFVSPSGVEDYILEFNEIEDDSYDENCDIVGFTVSPNVFTCAQAEDVVMVTLVAEDESGNLDSCTTIVSVSMELPEPEYQIGLCGDDNLSLFAEAPWAPGGTLYTYVWRNPDGNIISTEEDPVIMGVDASDSGPYTVEIEGLTGCTAIGVVNVIINSSPNVPLLSVSNNVLCDNDEIMLTTQSFSGTNVTYNWYSGIAPGGTLLTTTTLPVYNIPAPLATGSSSYYVVVELDGCTSDPSDFETITVSASPTASTNDAVINICEGEDIVLGTPDIGAGYTYAWTGPDGYNQSGQTPPVINGAGLNASGTYNLIITANGCSSNIATTVVNVTPTPTQPTVSTAGVACQGDNVILISNNNTANSYTWIGPDFSEIVTATNSLTLTNVTGDQSGNWSLYVTTNGCTSETSSPVSVFVEPTLTVVASNDGPICEGGDVSLLVNSIPGAIYSWTGPAGFISASQNPITTAVAGMYTVTVQSSTGCTNTASTSVAVSTAPTITALSNTGAPCVTGADDIMLVPTVFPPDDGTYTYLWIGPTGVFSTDVSPILPNGTSIDNGSYILEVTNSSGCVSNAVTTVVNVSDAPAPPALEGTLALCEGGTITITNTLTYVGTSVTYTWMTPLGTVTTSLPSLTIPNATSASSGIYTALVTVDGCTSLISNELTVEVGAVPPTPVITINNPLPLCEGANLELSTALIPGAEYIWTGPGNFDGSGHNPEVIGVTEDNEGTYQVQVVISGCPSTFSVPVTIEVNETPTSAIAINNGPVCKENGATLLLSVTPATAIPGATYTWINAQLGDTIAGPTTSLNAPVVDFTDFPTDGLYDFYVITNLNGCSSVNSIPTTVEINTAPNNEADAGADLSVCNGQSVSLSATAPTIGGGNWLQTAGPAVVIVNPNSPTTPLSGLVSGNSYTFLWTLSNGACMDYDSDEVIVNVDSDSESAFAGTDMSLCNQSSATLMATTAGTGVTGMWTQAPAQSALGVIISDPSDPNTTVTGMEPGNNYSFVWSLSNLGCGEFDADELNIEIEESNVVADAGLDFADCGNGAVELEALVTSSGAGTWSTTSTGLTISEPNNRRTTVEGLTTGIYTFVWTLDNGSCGITMDSIEIDYESAPTAMDDELSVSFAGENTIDVTVNDDAPGGFTVALLTNAVYGVVTNPSGSDFTYTSTSVYAGEDSFTYEICSEACPDECSSATVRVNVGEDALCTVPTIFTPNEDGVNDDFVIPCLASDRFPGNVVSIFNQWGDQVFRSAPYTNNWKGTYDGQDLPVGTYFYVIEFGNGEAVQSGFVVLER